jgi:hypothetical protein
MITFNRRKASLFEVDVAIGCLLGFYLGNGIQAHSGRAYKWCPFWGKMGATSVRLTSITRAYDHYAKSRTAVTFGTRGSGREGWTVTNPKEKMIKKMLQLLQQRAGSGPMLALLKMPVWEPESRMFVARQQKAPAAIGPEVSESSAEGKKKAATANHLAAMPMWWQKFDQTTHGAHQDNEIYRLLRWAPATKASRGGGFRKLLVTRKQEYLLLNGDQAGFNAVKAEQENAPLGTGTKRFWGVWAAAAEKISEYWLAEQQSKGADFLHKLRDQGKVGLANRREKLCSNYEEAWWLLWLEWESLWEYCPPQSDVITWNIGPQGVDLSFPLIAQTLSKGAAVVMFQEVSFHPEERRRVKGILKTIGSDYWCVMESSQRVRAGREDCKAGASTKNFEAPWVYAVVTFLHKDVFKQPTHLDWAAQYSNKAMRHMLQGRMSCLWAPRHSESPMLVINIHQAGSATLELQQRMWIAIQGIRAKHPEIQGIIGGDFLMQTHMAHEKDTLSAMRIISDEWMANFRLAWQQSKG